MPAQFVSHAFGSLLQHSISYLVPESIIDEFEAIEIGEGNGKRLIVSIGARQSHLKQQFT